MSPFALFILVARLMVKSKDNFHLFVRFALDAPVVHTLVIAHLDGLGPCISTDDYILLMNQNADTFVVQEDKHDLFHASTFYRHLAVPSDELYVRHM